MAIGLGKLFGFEFPENFNYPYMSKSVTEFWRRWHMTLGNWFHDVIYSVWAETGFLKKDGSLTLLLFGF